MTPGMYEYHTVPADQFIVSIHPAEGGNCLYQSVLGGRGGQEKVSQASNSLPLLHLLTISPGRPLLLAVAR